MKQYQNFVFDLYGTLVDIHTDEEQPSFWRACSRYLGMQGVHYEPGALRQKYESSVKALEAQKRLTLPQGAEPEIDIGEVFKSLYRDAGLEADERTIADFARTFRLLSLKRLKLFPGVIKLLDAIHENGKQVYLLSNAQTLFTRPELVLLGLDRKLDGSILSSEAGRKKPDPGFYQLMMDMYELNPAETVMVGNDDQCDCWGAHKAGLDSIYVSTWQSPKLSGPLPENCVTLNKIADLTDMIEGAD